MTLVKLALVAAVVATPLAAASAQDFSWHGKIAAGKTLEIKGINGDIQAVASSASEAEVIAVKHARRSDPKKVEIKVVEHGNGVTICAAYPSDGRRPNTCEPGPGGHMDAHDNDVAVNFTVKVPTGVRFAGRTVNGAVRATDLDGSAVLSTVNGGITASAQGTIEAETVNGSLNLTLGRADWTGDLELKTVNGSITVDLPAALSTELQAETVNGSIESDFPLSVQGKINPRSIHATIGKGGRGLRLSTVNGSIRLKKTG
jgi:hypothetical protein